MSINPKLIGGVSPTNKALLLYLISIYTTDSFGTHCIIYCEMAFSIPTVEDIKETKIIKSDSEPVLFKRKLDNPSEKNIFTSSSSGLSPSLTAASSPLQTTSASESLNSELQETQGTTVAAAYQPHAIIVNTLQVSKPLK